jgi:hypothetical protein
LDVDDVGTSALDIAASQSPVQARDPRAQKIRIELDGVRDRAVGSVEIAMQAE